MELKFFYCEHCGNIIAYTTNSGVRIECCGEEMKEIVPNTVEASKEKHIPVIKKEGNLVTVEIGSVPHPMLEEHYIEWVVLRTKQGNQRKGLKPGQAPSVTFALVDGDEVVEALAFCNLHGLWKATY